MRKWFTLLIILVTAGASRAQLKVENGADLVAPSSRAQVIFTTTCRIVHQEFHLKGAELREFPLRLVLGSSEDRYEDDHDAGIYRIFLTTWDEKKFAVGVMRLAIEAMVSTQQRDRLVQKILTRSNAITPLDARAAEGGLRRDKFPPPVLSAFPLTATPPR